jgi:hypothetical protein
VSADQVILKSFPQLGDRLPQFSHRILDARDEFAEFRFGLPGHFGAGLSETAYHPADRRLHSLASFGAAVPRRRDLSAQPSHVNG